MVHYSWNCQKGIYCYSLDAMIKLTGTTVATTRPRRSRPHTVGRLNIRNRLANREHPDGDSDPFRGHYCPLLCSKPHSAHPDFHGPFVRLLRLARHHDLRAPGGDIRFYSSVSNFLFYHASSSVTDMRFNRFAAVQVVFIGSTSVSLR